MAIVFAPPSLHMQYTSLSVYIQFICKLDFVNILPVLNNWREKLYWSVYTCTAEGHERLGERLRKSSYTRDMNCDWQNDAVTLPRVEFPTKSADDEYEDSNFSSGTHSDTASMPYQYLIEQDIERERKNLRIAEALSKQSIATTSANVSSSGCETHQDDGVFEATEGETSIVENNRCDSFKEEDIASSGLGNVDDTFGQSMHIFEDDDENGDIELTMEEEEEEEDEDIVPEALVNNKFFNDTFEAIDTTPSRGHFEDLLMDDIEPNDEKVVHESSFSQIITSSSSNCPFTMNRSSFIKDSLKLPKVISNEIITNDQMSPALLRALNKSSILPYRNGITIYNKDFYQCNNNINLENVENEKNIDSKNSVKDIIETNINNFNQENVRLTRSNVKLSSNSNDFLFTANSSSSNPRSFETTQSLKNFEDCYREQLNEEPIYKTEIYENKCTNMDNSISKNYNSVSVDESSDKRVKINMQKLISDLTYGIKIVVERLDLSSIPR